MPNKEIKGLAEIINKNTQNEIEEKNELSKVNIRELWENFKQIYTLYIYIHIYIYTHIYIYIILYFYIMKPSENKVISIKKYKNGRNKLKVK